jgi:exodeoxyribonuclease-3
VEGGSLEDPPGAAAYAARSCPPLGPTFDYTLRWFDQLARYARRLLARDTTVVLAGDYNIIPTEIGAARPLRWLGDALYFPESRAAYRDVLAQDWTDAVRELHPGEAIFSQLLRTRRWHPHRPPPAQPTCRGAARCGRVDRAVRGWEKKETESVGFGCSRVRK